VSSAQTPLLQTDPTPLQLISLVQHSITLTVLIQENCTPGNKEYTKRTEGNGKGRKDKVMTPGLVSSLTLLFDLLFAPIFLVCCFPVLALKG